MEFGYWRRRHRGKSRLFISSSARRTDWLSDFLPPAVPFFHRAIYRGSDADSGPSRVTRTRNLCPKSRVAPVRRGADRSHHEYKFSLINRRRHQVAVERPTSRVGWESEGEGKRGEGPRDDGDDDRNHENSFFFIFTSTTRLQDDPWRSSMAYL